MLPEELIIDLLKFNTYVPVFPQLDPSVALTTLPADAKDGVVYEISKDDDLVLGDTIIHLKKHDLLVRTNGKWELGPAIDRNKIKFEIWAKDKGFIKTKTNTTFEDNEYIQNNPLQAKWVIWLAATAATISG